MEDLCNGFLNLTGHNVRVVLPSGYTKTFPPSGIIARVDSKPEKIAESCMIPLFKTTYGEVQNLPKERKNIFLIVSAMVRNALPERKDLVSPCGLITDKNGNVIGCEGFDCNL